MLKHADVMEAEATTIKVVDTRVAPYVRVLNGALDDDPGSPGGIILNGRLDPTTIRFLRVDQEYQRPLGDRPDIYEALKAGTIVPNVDIGVRGQEFETDGDDFIIRSPAFIIDGWQRVGTALRLLEMVPEHPMRIFATIHFGTDSLWERHRFTELNKNVKKVSPNLHLRNMRDSNEAILTLFGLSNNTKDFALYRRVCWAQNMKRSDLVTALVVARTVRLLHAHRTTLAGQTVLGIADALIKAAMNISLPVFRRNVSTFFATIEEAWGLSGIEYRHAAPQVKGPFLASLARVFTAHLDFWDDAGRILQVNADLRRKLATFPVRDPQITQLSGAGGQASRLLSQLLVNHLNSGKRTHRLRSRFEG